MSEQKVFINADADNITDIEKDTNPKPEELDSKSEAKTKNKKNSDGRTSVSYRFPTATVQSIEKAAKEYSMSQTDFIIFSAQCMADKLDRKSIEKLLNERKNLSKFFPC
jgi:hypothetical protein